MRKLYNESIVIGREVGTPIRLKTNGKLTLKRGLIFTNEDIGNVGSVDIGCTEDLVGFFHTHIDPPIADLSAGDVCSIFFEKRFNSIECVAGADGVWCYRLRTDKKHKLPRKTMKLMKLCFKNEDKAGDYLDANYKAILKLVEGEKQYIGKAPLMLKKR